MLIATALGIIHRARNRIRLSAFRARYELRARFLQNAMSRWRFRRRVPSLNTGQRRAVHDLLACGLALAQWDELGVDAEDFRRLGRIAQDLAHRTKVERAIDNVQISPTATPPASDAYLAKLHSERPTLALRDPLLQVALGTPILDTVNSYLGLCSKLIYADVWHSRPVDPRRRIGSQRWHRDPEDRHMVKVYLYFADADEGAGTLEYVVGSCAAGTGPYRNLWPWKPRGARYPNEGELERRVSTSSCRSCEGPAGTIVFCDTDGFHRGGITTTGVRLLATWTFVTPASLSMLTKRRFDLDATRSDLVAISPTARFALR
jgi:hypothetical protein